MGARVQRPSGAPVCWTRRSGGRVGGLFITMEGVEGSGKSTQLRLLARRLEALGLPLLVSKEPGGTALGQELRTLLLAPHASGERWCPEAELLLFYADRVQHVATRIRPALEAGQVVLVDRFEDSSRAYQGACGVPEERLEALSHLALGGFRPDITLILDLDPEEGLRRVTARNGALGGAFRETRFDEAALAFHVDVRQRFQAIAAREPERAVLVPARGTEDTVAEALWAQVAPRLVAAGFRGA